MPYDYVFDSYAWVEYFAGTAKGRKVKEYLQSGHVVTPTIVIAELSNKYHREGWKHWPEDLQFITAKTVVFDLTFKVAVEAGKFKNEIRRRHKDFGLADAIIYETAELLGAEVVTGDKHFKGLKRAILL